MAKITKKTSSSRSKAPALQGKEKTQISISLPDLLVKQVDQLAAAEHRNRSNFIANAMAKVVGLKEG